jgi:hypothetical protein
MGPYLFPFNAFTDAEGDPLSFGYLLIALSSDAVTPNRTQLCYRRTAYVPLDVNGLLSDAVLFWPNVSLVPANTYYILKAYSANGELMLGPLLVMVGPPGSGTGGGTGFGTGFGTAFGSNFGS